MLGNVLLLALSLNGEPATAPAAAAAAPEAAGRECTRLFYAGSIDTLWARFTPEMKTALKSVENLRSFRDGVSAQLGAETSVVSEKMDEVSGWSVYVRRARFEKAPVEILVQWSLDAKGGIGGFFIRPADPPKEALTKHLAYQTKTSLRLPFMGEWFVFWGGRTVAENYHAATVDQRFAYDLLVMKNGKSHPEGKNANEDHYAYGQPILAPAGGTVTVAVDGVADNVPGLMNASVPPGNHVVLDHGNGEFSLLAHFKPGTLKVKKGDRVESGQVLGLCGNSGNSSEPHLHYHLQNGPAFHEGEGLPAPFVDYEADGKAVSRGEPVKGQTIRPAAKK